jgi:hypothetical protein
MDYGQSWKTGLHSVNRGNVAILVCHMYSSSIRLALLTIINSVMTLVTLARSRIRHMQTNQAPLLHSVPRRPRQSTTLIFPGYQAKRPRTACIPLSIYNFLNPFFFSAHALALAKITRGLRIPRAVELRKSMFLKQKQTNKPASVKLSHNLRSLPPSRRIICMTPAPLPFMIHRQRFRIRTSGPRCTSVSTRLSAGVLM